MTEQQRMKRNLNPTPAARVAMIIWGEEYARQRGGSMDFWDQLSVERRHLCQLIVNEVPGLALDVVQLAQENARLRPACKSALESLDHVIAPPNYYVPYARQVLRDALGEPKESADD